MSTNKHSKTASSYLEEMLNKRKVLFHGSDSPPNPDEELLQLQDQAIYEKSKSPKNSPVRKGKGPERITPEKKDIFEQLHEQVNLRSEVKGKLKRANTIIPRSPRPSPKKLARDRINILEIPLKKAQEDRLTGVSHKIPAKLPEIHAKNSPNKYKKAIAKKKKAPVYVSPKKKLPAAKPPRPSKPAPLYAIHAAPQRPVNPPDLSKFKSHQKISQKPKNQTPPQRPARPPPKRTRVSLKPKTPKQSPLKISQKPKKHTVINSEEFNIPEGWEWKNRDKITEENWKIKYPVPAPAESSRNLAKAYFKNLSAHPSPVRRIQTPPRPTSPKKKIRELAPELPSPKFIPITGELTPYRLSGLSGPAGPSPQKSKTVENATIPISPKWYKKLFKRSQKTLSKTKTSPRILHDLITQGEIKLAKLRGDSKFQTSEKIQEKYVKLYNTLRKYGKELQSQGIYRNIKDLDSQAIEASFERPSSQRDIFTGPGGPASLGISTVRFPSPVSTLVSPQSLEEARECYNKNKKYVHDAGSADKEKSKGFKQYQKCLKAIYKYGGNPYTISIHSSKTSRSTGKENQFTAAERMKKTQQIVKNQRKY